MSDKVHRYLVAYDVTSDARRTRVAKTLESYGDRLQYSVFLVDIKPARMMRLRAAITGQMDLGTDSLLVCDIGPLTGGQNQHIHFLGATRSFTGHGPLVL
jgi:CRISPR-associated protein Cas2